MATSTDVDEAAFKVQPLTETQADAVRGDFLVCNDRVADARPLLERVLQDDPTNVSAHETMGFLEFRADHLDQARKWYEKAVKLDSQSYIAHYYYAAIAMSAGASGGDDAQVEASLRAAIKLNPSFAPPFERLAAFEGMRRQNLDEAHMMILAAVQLDPGNVSYRMTTASVLMQMERGKDAMAVLHEALRMAKSPAETAMVENSLAQVERYAAARERQTEGQLKFETQTGDASAGTIAADAGAPNEELPKGPHRFLLGTLQNVHCHVSEMDLTMAAKTKTMSLHSSNFYKIGYTALGFAPKGDLNPCKDLEGMAAKVEYVESSAQPPVAHVVAIELHK